MIKRAFLFLITICLSVFIFTACQQTKPNEPASADAKRFPFKGKVVSVDQAKKEAIIDHEEIPDYMPAMRMPFPIKEEWVMEELRPGAEVRAELVVDKGTYFLERIGIVALPNPDDTPPPSTAKAGGTVEGADLPNFSLTDQDNKRFDTNSLRGKTVAITFIYTRCPIPTYCPRMSINFSEVAMNLQKQPDLKDKVVLLSITFDPKYDTPAVLKKYGEGYYNKDFKPDFNVWKLATGSEDDVRKVADFFGLYYRATPEDQAVIDHSLRTVVVAPDGKVRKVFAGNEWGSAELMREIQNSLK